MSEIEGIASTEFDELLKQVHLSELDVVDSCTNERRLDMSEELLDVVLAPTDDTLSMLGMSWEVSGTVFRLWMLPFMGVVMALIDHTINYSLIRTFHLSK